MCYLKRFFRTFSYEISDKVNWQYTSCGGYGYTQNIAAIIGGITDKQVQKEIRRKIGNEWVQVTRSIKAKP